MRRQLTSSSTALSPHALLWTQLPTFGSTDLQAQRYFGSASRYRHRTRQAKERTDRQQQTQQPQKQPSQHQQQQQQEPLTDEQLEALEANKEHEANKLAEHIARIRHHRRQFAPLRSFIHTTPSDYTLPAPLRHKLDTIAQQHSWNNKLTNQYNTTQPELWTTLVRSPPQLATLVRILHEVRVRLPWLPIRHVLDVGFGSGVGAWAVREVWGFDGGVEEYVAVETNSRMQQLGRNMTDKIEWRIKHNQSITLPLLAAQPTTIHSHSTGHKPRPATGAMDVVLSAYGLSRVGRDKRRAQLDVMWRSVRRGGVLVVVEEGTKEGFEVVRAAREYVLQNYSGKSKLNGESHQQPTASSTDLQAPSSSTTQQHPFLFSLPSPPSAAAIAVTPNTPIVLAPCGHNASCPQGKDGVCSFGRRVMISSLPVSSPYRALKTDGELGGLLIEKFSYVVLHKGPIVPPASAEDDAGVAEMMTEELEDAAEYDKTVHGDELQAQTDVGEAAEERDEEDDATEEEEQEYESTDAAAEADDTFSASSTSIPLPAAFFSSRYHRVMSPPLLRPKHVTIDLCTTDAKLQRWTIPKSAGLEGGYQQARDTKWGDLWNRPKVQSSTQKRKEERRRRDKEAGKMQEPEDVDVASVEEETEPTAPRTNGGRAGSSVASGAAPMKLKVGQPVHEILQAIRDREYEEKRATRKTRQRNSTAAAAIATDSHSSVAVNDNNTQRTGADPKRSSREEDEEEEEEDEEEDEDEEMDEENEEEEEPDRNTRRARTVTPTSRRRSS